MHKKIAYMAIDANVITMLSLLNCTALSVQIEPSGPGSCR